MGNFKSQYATDNRVESIIHITNMIVRAGMQINKDKGSDTDYFVMSGNTVETIINAYQNKNAKSALVIDDLGLQVINRLKQEGVTDITLCLTRIPDKMFALTKARIKKTFKDFNINIISLEELTYMNVDLVIANPPYGKLGANITKEIIDKVDFKEYINLLPMVDYEKADNGYELWRHVDVTNISACPGGFEDAGVSPLMVKISASKTVNTLTADEFRIQCLENKLAAKYFKENLVRQSTFIATEQFKDCTLEKCIALPLRTKSGNHGGQANLGKTEKSQFYLINNNIKQSITAEENKSICCTTINFTTSTEKQNVANLFYSDLGYKFTSWLMTGMHRDAFHLREHTFWFPKVDWTHSWTVEEILADYGYTEEEIQEVMDDLKNYKGMDD